ncbi:hypothetical protein DL96DRAFT_1110483 [Flagelloscypha sp. PMI_526]|nr:hypothetical protein DL96DRAFT_1110483 [Flagelloscypha sp. PMI_526]
MVKSPSQWFPEKSSPLDGTAPDSNLLRLPNEVILRILSFCSPKEILRFRRTCTSGRALSQDVALWKRWLKDELFEQGLIPELFTLHRDDTPIQELEHLVFVILRQRRDLHVSALTDSLPCLSVALPLAGPEWAKVTLVNGGRYLICLNGMTGQISIWELPYHCKDGVGSLVTSVKEPSLVGLPSNLTAFSKVKEVQLQVDCIVANVELSTFVLSLNTSQLLPHERRHTQLPLSSRLVDGPWVLWYWSNDSAIIPDLFVLNTSTFTIARFNMGALRPHSAEISGRNIIVLESGSGPVLVVVHVPMEGRRILLAVAPICLEHVLPTHFDEDMLEWWNSVPSVPFVVDSFTELDTAHNGAFEGPVLQKISSVSFLVQSSHIGNLNGHANSTIYDLVSAPGETHSVKIRGQLTRSLARDVWSSLDTSAVAYSNSEILRCIAWQNVHHDSVQVIDIRFNPKLVRYLHRVQNIGRINSVDPFSGRCVQIAQGYGSVKVFDMLGTVRPDRREKERSESGSSKVGKFFRSLSHGAPRTDSSGSIKPI